MAPGSWETEREKDLRSLFVVCIIYAFDHIGTWKMSPQDDWAMMTSRQQGGAGSPMASMTSHSRCHGRSWLSQMRHVACERTEESVGAGIEHKLSWQELGNGLEMVWKWFDERGARCERVPKSHSKTSVNLMCGHNFPVTFNSWRPQSAPLTPSWTDCGNSKHIKTLARGLHHRCFC